TQCKIVQMREYCNHSMICEDCLRCYLQTKIRDEDITPWLRCPAPDCYQPVHPDLLLGFLQQKVFVYFFSFVHEHLTRNPNWIRCTNSNGQCDYGFIVTIHSKEETQKACKACGFLQLVSKNPIKSDPGFQDLLKSGVLRLCPKCEFPTMKDKGLCNVMQCGQCGIWWNWKTFEFGSNSQALKNRARMNGTLWFALYSFCSIFICLFTPFVLLYQQRLERENPEEFRKLLERNGIKYDPNYIRGT
ncbi:hypothetical protein RFI_32248, partial [Reticulomyxa filosa]